jgi:hypothetical protein
MATSLPNRSEQPVFPSRKTGCSRYFREHPIIKRFGRGWLVVAQRGRGAGLGRNRGVGVGVVLPPSHAGAHMPPSLNRPRRPARLATSLGARYPSPIGGITKSPINASAAAIASWIQLGSAPAAMFNFAAINWWASISKPFPRTGSCRMARSCSCV